ncbi:hypothetical protein ACFO5O_02075 [Geojedonia litorea]|uniref:CarboxypepD_reg-like domain-containing protein n=1 Tax=Geojedonia litorea TaxID=1268269 RepID=A0ABV9N0Y0_9FLAO
MSYATVSFGNGYGIFADDDGVFYFSKKLYPDVDSLHISALGYKDLSISTQNLASTIYLETQADELDEILINVKVDRKFSEETLKPYLDDDYYHCWLPTIESEIAVFFPNTKEQLTKITNIHFPITLESKDWEKRKRKNADKKPFSTLFKVKFYKNNNGIPGEVMTYDNIVFRATERNGDNFNLDVSNNNLFVPSNGFFVSIQVLGYTDKVGKLLPNKKYKEIKSNNGVVKIPTNFRPLLPFTDKISTNRTFIKRVFLNDNKWIQFMRGNIIDSSLLRAGLNNYGVGVTYRVYKDD